MSYMTQCKMKASFGYFYLLTASLYILDILSEIWMMPGKLLGISHIKPAIISIIMLLAKYTLLNGIYSAVPS